MKRRQHLDDLATAIELDNKRHAPSAPPETEGPAGSRDASAVAVAAEQDARPRGRPPLDTLGIHLRLGRNLDEWLQDEAIAESGRQRRTVTKQQMIVRLLEAARSGKAAGRG